MEIKPGNIVNLKKDRTDFNNKYVDKIMEKIMGCIVEANNKGKVIIAYDFSCFNDITSEHKRIIIERFKKENIYAYLQDDNKICIYWEFLTYKKNRKAALINRYNWVIYLLLIVALIIVGGLIVGFVPLFKAIGIGILGLFLLFCITIFCA